jgi:hypothetical protein
LLPRRRLLQVLTCARSRQSDLQKNLAKLGSYTCPVTPAETTAFVHQQQNIWNLVLADIAQKQQK